MQTTHRARHEKRLIVGIAASMLAIVGCSVCVIEQPKSLDAEDTLSQPFWASAAPTSNLAVVELQRSGAGSWSSAR